MVSRLETLLYTDLSHCIQSLALYVSDIRMNPDLQGPRIFTPG